MEIFRKIKLYENYEVSNNWNVRSINFNRTWKMKTLKLLNDKDWYLLVWLCNKWISKTQKVHRLVAQAFLENTENKKTVNHKNWIKTDNRVKNLEWNTRSENMIHSYKIFKRNKNKKIIMQYSIKWVFIKEWESIRFAWRILNLSPWNICYCCKWKIKKCWNFIWRYK